MTEVQKHLEPWSQWHDWRPQLPFWDISKMQGKTYYSKTMTDNAGRFTFEVTICFDPTTGLVNFVAEEIRD